LRTPSVAPLIANANVPIRSGASTTDTAIVMRPQEERPPSCKSRAEA